jgi:carboxylesterase
MRRVPAVLVTLLIVAAVAALLFRPVIDPRAYDRLPSQGNEPIDIAGRTDRGVLLLHGMTATPWEIRTLASSLQAHNYTIVAPVIAGHGTSAAELEATTWRDWYASANDSLAVLKGRTDRVYIVGMSTGASLAVLLAAENHVDGIVLIATPIKFRDWRAPFARWYALALPYTDHTQYGGDVAHYYEVTPSRSVAELNDMISEVENALPAVQSYALILQSLHDQTVDPVSATYVFDRLGSRDKEWKLYGNASHVILQNLDADKLVFPAIADFIERH